MISFNKKSGFSLAESVISLMIMSLVILLTFAAITRKKTVPVSKTTISGVYACWKEGGSLKQKYYDGHHQIDEKLITGNGIPSGYDCRFKMDRRAYKYYVVAVGSRGDRSSSAPNYVDGQFQQVMFPTPTGAPGDNMFLDIKLGDVSGSTNGGVTSVFHGEDKVVEVIGGVSKNTSKLVGGNIKSCKWISKNPCTPAASYTVTCEVRETTSDILASVGKNPYKTNLVLTCKNNNTKKVDNNKSCEIEIDSLIETDGRYKGSCIKGSGTILDDVLVKVEEKDSSYKAEINTKTKDSYFVHYLKMIPQKIQNGLTDDLLNYYQKNSNKKNGVVLIIW